MVRLFGRSQGLGPRPQGSGEGPSVARVATLGIGLLFIVASIVVYVFFLPSLGTALMVGTVITMMFVLTERDPTMVLSIYALLLLLIPSHYVVPQLGALGTPAKVVGVAAFIWWIASRLSHNVGGDHGWQPVRTALLVFLWWMMTTYALGWLRPLSPVEASASTRVLISLITLVGVALLAADGTVDRKRLETLLRRIVALTGIVAIIGLFQYFGIDFASYLRFPGLELNAELVSIRGRSDFSRVAGTAIHAIEFGVLLAVVAPFALHFAFYGKRGRIEAWIWAIAILVALPTALSRSAVVGIVISLGVLAVRWTWNQRLLLAGAGLVLIALTRAVAPGLLGTLRALFLWWGADDSISGRTDDYGPVYGYVSESPWVGRGLGTFEPSEYFILDNEWLMTALGTGVVGVVALLAVVVVACSCSRGVTVRASDVATRHLGQAFLAALLAMAVLFGTFDAFSFNIAAGVFFLVVGMTGGLWRIEVGDVDFGRDRSGRLPRTKRRTPEYAGATS